MEAEGQRKPQQEQLQQAEEDGAGTSDPLYTDLDLPAADVQTNEVKGTVTLSVCSFVGHE